MKRLTCLTAVLFSAIFSCQLYAQNVVTDWAAIVQPPLNTPAKIPAVQNILRAMVHIAVYDAVVAIEGGFEPFAAGISAPAGSDVRAAAATAAYLTARARWRRRNSRAGCCVQHLHDGHPRRPGKKRRHSCWSAGRRRSPRSACEDGMSNVVLYACSSNPAQPGNSNPMAAVIGNRLARIWAEIEPFTLISPDQFRRTVPTRSRRTHMSTTSSRLAISAVPTVPDRHRNKPISPTSGRPRMSTRA